MEFLKDYGLFLAEVVTIVLAISVVIALIASQKQKKSSSGHIEVDKINEKIDAMSTALKEVICKPEQLKQEKKQQEKQLQGKQQKGKKLLEKEEKKPLKSIRMQKVEEKAL